MKTLTKKAKRYIHIIIAMLLIIPAMLMLLNCSPLGLMYAYILYKLSYTRIGVKLVKSLLKMNLLIK